MFDQRQRGDHDAELELEEELERERDPRRSAGKRSRIDARYREASVALSPGRLRALMQQAMAGAGAPLPSSLRARFERSLGMDLGSVRVHRGGGAADAASAIDALAFAHRGQVFLGDGAAASDTPAGERLLAHEVAHAVQQRGAGSSAGPLGLSTPGDALERSADSAAGAMMIGARAQVAPGGAQVIARATPSDSKDASGSSDASENAGGPKVEVKFPAVATGTPITFDGANYKELYKQVKARADQNLEAGSVTAAGAADYDPADTPTKAVYTITMTMSLPSWTHRDTQPEADKKKYDTWAASVKAHEEQHVKIYKDEYNKLKTTVVGPSETECESQYTTVATNAETAQTNFDKSSQPDALPIPGGTEKVGGSSASASDSDSSSAPAPTAAPAADSSAADTADSDAADVRRSASGEAVSDDAAARLAAARGRSGMPLPPWLRARFERSLGTDLSAVRVHADDSAGAAARAVGARAFAHGQDVFFAEGRYQPDSSAGQRLLAHEVAHTVQTAAGSSRPGLSAPGEAIESDADAAADAMMEGAPAAVHAGSADVVARDGEPRSDLAADMLEVPTFNQTPGGVTTAAPSESDPDLGPGEVLIKAGRIEFAATVNLKSGITIGDGQEIQVGPTQTLMGSTRTGIYRRRDGSVAAEYTTGASREMRDAGASQRADGRPVPEPFYWEPGVLTDNTRSRNVPFADQPQFVIPGRMGDDAVLTETRGQESFRTALSAKRGGTLLHLRTLEWSVPWDVTISPDRTGTGGAQTGASTTGPGAAPPTLSGAIPNEASHEWMRFTDVATARAAGWQTLIRYIGDARTQDPQAYQIMREALFGLNPFFSVTVRCDREYSGAGSDSVTMTVTGHSARSGSWSMRQRGSNTLRFRMFDVFDIERINNTARLGIVVNVGGVFSTLHGNEVPWVFPWAASGTGVSTDEREYNNAYHVSGSCSEGGEADPVPAGAAAATMAPSGGGGARGAGGDGGGGTGGADGGT
jgi:hypothetical protein